MPGLDRELDPETGDWIPDGKGGWKRTALPVAAVMHAMRDRLGWPGNPNDGGALDDLTTMSAAEAAVEAPNRIRTSLQPLLDDGILRSVDVEVKRDGSRVFVRTQVVDAAGGTHDVSNLTPFGG